MFRKSRRKIVASIMSVLVLVWVGTLAIIYTSSFVEMKRQNRRMLQTRAQMFELTHPSNDWAPPVKPSPEGSGDPMHKFDSDSPMFQLATFYTVAFSYEGEVLEIQNERTSVHSNESLEALAKEIVAERKESGTRKDLSFYQMDKGGYYLVTFMDNTIVNSGALTLFRYTLLFGGLALVLFFFLSRHLARRIVSPLEESYQKQKQFISDAGHELKTPVSIVGANAELLSRELGDNTWLQNIQYENERMGQLVTQLLDLARAENATLPTERLDFSHLVAGEALPFESLAFDKGLTLSSDISTGIEVQGNSTQLKQLLSILLDNAIRHSLPKGEVRLRLTRERGLAKLSVTNYGNSIPKDQTEKIFERFYRLDSVRNSAGNHYGLGLSIAKAITSAHKGQIHVHCHDGLVEFQVQLPSL